MNEQFNKRLAVISSKAELARSIAVSPQFRAGAYIEDEKERTESILEAMNEISFMESLSDESKTLIGSAWGSAVQNYCDTYGRMPSDELMASAAASLENMLEGKTEDSDGRAKIMLESVEGSMSKSDGVIVRDNMAALILPVMLQQATSACCTFIPAGRDQADIFRIHTVAGSSFGDISKGQILDPSTRGQYSQMRQRYAFPAGMQPDAVMTTHTLTPSTDLNVGKAMAVRKNRTRIYADGVQIGGDTMEGSTAIYGELAGNAIDNTQSSVDLTTGVVTIKFAAAVASGVTLSVQVEVDIEADPTLIPIVTQTMEQKTLRPAQYAVAAESSVMAQWAMKREFNMDTQTSLLTQMRNKLASEKDAQVLSDIRFHTIHENDFDAAVPSGIKKVDHYRTLAGHIAKKSQEMMARTTISGIVGAFVDSEAYQFLADMEGDGFEFAPNYAMKPYIHYIGRLFGQYDIYLDPFAPAAETATFLWFGRGQTHTQAGYVVGDAVPPIRYNHPTSNGLVDRDTLWGHGYREIHPYNGEDFFERTTLLNLGTYL